MSERRTLCAEQRISNKSPLFVSSKVDCQHLAESTHKGKLSDSLNVRSSTGRDESSIFLIVPDNSDFSELTTVTAMSNTYYTYNKIVKKVPNLLLNDVPRFKKISYMYWKFERCGRESRTGRDCRMRRMRYVIYAEVWVPGIRRWAAGWGYEGTDIGYIIDSFDFKAHAKADNGMVMVSTPPSDTEEIFGHKAKFSAKG
ncbi:hypothetical protein EAG_15777 [Camponotus floridanus]|uniref:Uncharacterized protein n=1 Tax=Camponotus floridanus TaxID=104421 RepID=E2A472_CAMFO|nr:hypothetical protein EAG_15777 [Camponotus floridanus]